jgi:PPOX class probable F420-dependent enzyme
VDERKSCAVFLELPQASDRLSFIGRNQVFVILKTQGAPAMASKQIPEKFLDLLTGKKALASIATVMPDGSPQVTPVWFDYTNGKIRINTARGRVKAKNLKAGAKVALAIIDPENPYRYIGIRGRVVGEDEKKADAHIDSLAKKYLNQDKYPFRQPGEVRVSYDIEPESVHVMG